MKFTFPQLLAGTIGALLIYCAITNQTPVGVIKGGLGGTPTGPGNDPSVKVNTPYTGSPSLQVGNPPIGGGPAKNER